MVTPLVHTLTRFDKARIYTHFIRLSEDDRYLRFGLYRDAARLHDYVDEIDFERDLVLGVFDREFDLAAVAHVGLVSEVAELGLSVLPPHRRRHFGSLLLQRAARRAQVRGFRRLWIHCLRENRAILALARKAGMQIVTSGAEADATLDLPALTSITYGLDAVEREFALWMRPYGLLRRCPKP